MKEGGYHIRTGFPGTPFILFALCDNGRGGGGLPDAPHRYLPLLALRSQGGHHHLGAVGRPREDSTCNTGKDDGTNGMTSFNHYASGAVGGFPLPQGGRELRVWRLDTGSSG